MMKFYAAILAGGQGIRLGHDTPKQFLTLGGRPVIAWSIAAFAQIAEVTGIVVVTPEAHRGHTHRIIEETGLAAKTTTIAGGTTRQGSAYNALMSMPFGDNDIIIFHDAARPFVSGDIITRCMQDASLHGAAAVYVKAVDTIAEGGEGFVRSIPERDRLYYTQTPQAFRYAVIREAHEKALANNLTNATDDVKLVLDAGYRVKIVDGDYRNIKITTPFDYELAQYIAERPGR